MQHPAYRLIQLAAKSLGHDPGPADGWYGPDTHAATTALSVQGPIQQTPWAVSTLHRGLAGLGYMEGPIGDRFDAATFAALRLLVAAEGLPAASRVTTPEVLDPVKPVLRPVAHGSVMRQGAAGTVVDTFMMHCAAVPGD